MNIKPINQTILYGLGNIFNEIINLNKLNIMPNKILFSGPKGIGKSTLAYHIINYLFSKNEPEAYKLDNYTINSNNKSYKLVCNNSHPNFYLIDLFDEKKNIEISQIRKMINYTYKSSFNNSLKIILIDNIEYLNDSSSNALLKIIEEPNENCYFILIHNINKKISETLKSRCIIYKANLSFNKSIEITNKIINDDIFNLINKDLISQYNTPGDLINLLNFSKNNNIDLNDYNLKDFLIYLIKNSLYKKNDYIKYNIYNFIELYFLKILIYSNNKSLLTNIYTKFVNKNKDVSNFNLDTDTLFMEFKSKVLNG